MKQEWLRFEDAGTSESGKTRRWLAVNKRTLEVAGEVRYRYGCRGYAFYPTSDFFFDANCMEQIGKFLREHSQSMQKRASVRI